MWFKQSRYEARTLMGCRLKFKQQDEREIGSVGQKLQEMFVDNQDRRFVYKYGKCPFQLYKVIRISMKL